MIMTYVAVLVDKKYFFFTMNMNQLQYLPYEIATSPNVLSFKTHFLYIVNIFNLYDFKFYVPQA